MKYILIIIIITLRLFASASTYYVKINGNDSTDGLTDATAWATISKVNSSFSGVVAGDSILFKKDNSFYGTLTNSKSGLSGFPITLGSYGTGSQPKITGFTTITSGWTNEGNGIYSISISSDAQTNMLLIDGLQYAMGRWPKKTTYNTFKSHDGSISITDTVLAASPNWTGAEVVIRQNFWTLNRYPVTNHDGNVITFGGGNNSEVDDNFGYFIQNDLRTLSIDPIYGEWYHDYSGTGKLYVYFGAVNPTSTVVKVATRNNLLNSNTCNYITIKDLSFSGSISDALAFNKNSCTHITVTGCNIEYAGKDGISQTSDYSTITGNIIKYCNQSAVDCGGSNNTISKNEISNIGLLLGQIYVSYLSTGIRVVGTNTINNIVEYNTLTNLGYNGIFGGRHTSATVRYNFINYSCMTINDGGGIYYETTTNDSLHRWTIEHNIILNSYGNTNGTNFPTTYLGEGIYLDSWVNNCTVRYNTCANNRGCGIKLGSAHGNTVQNNLCFNNEESALYLIGSWEYPTVYDNIIDNNILFAKTKNQFALKIRLSSYDNIANYGTSDYNFYARPIDDHNVICIFIADKNTYRTLDEWQSWLGQDAHSKKSPIALSDSNGLLFYCNETNANKVVASLSIPMVDVLGNTYPAGDLTLSPWSGIVLMPTCSGK